MLMIKSLQSSTFKVRREVLIAVRNKVLLPMFEDVSVRDVQSAYLLRPIFASICFSANDGTPAHRRFEMLAADLFFDDEVWKAMKVIDDNDRNVAASRPFGTLSQLPKRAWQQKHRRNHQDGDATSVDHDQAAIQDVAKTRPLQRGLGCVIGV